MPTQPLLSLKSKFACQVGCVVADSESVPSCPTSGQPLADCKHQHTAGVSKQSAKAIVVALAAATAMVPMVPAAAHAAAGARAAAPGCA